MNEYTLCYSERMHTHIAYYGTTIMNEKYYIAQWIQSILVTAWHTHKHTHESDKSFDSHSPPAHDEQRGDVFAVCIADYIAVCGSQATYISRIFSFGKPYIILEWNACE